MNTSDDYSILELNHVALNVGDVAACERFYGEVLRLPALDRPAFGFPGAWFGIGGQQELHLIGERTEDGSKSRGHFAMLVSDLDAVATRLESAGVEFRGPKSRPDGARQILTANPDGNVIELCDNLPGRG
jgi:catechol 2,3-dioxygenase-like lactoylglutathione lyase family enzyme